MKLSPTHLKVQRYIRSNSSALLLLFSGLVGFAASFALTLDKIHLLQNPDFIPACNINPIVSCLSAMSSAQSEVFGVPNSLMGMVLYTALCVASALLLLKVKFPKTVWLAMLACAGLGIIFVHYLIIQSLFFLHVICPWCLTIWLTTPLLALSLASLYARTFKGAKDPSRFDTFIRAIVKYRSFIAAVWYVLLALTIFVVFQDAWLAFVG